MTAYRSLRVIVSSGYWPIMASKGVEQIERTRGNEICAANAYPRRVGERKQD